MSASMEIRTALRYVSRRWRGLWPMVDAVQDLVEALKGGDQRAAGLAAWALAPFVDRAAGAVIAVAPRSRPGSPSLAPLAHELAAILGGAAMPDLLVRREPVPSSRLRRRRGKPGVSLERHAATIRLARGVPERPVLVVDDVLTSGATLRACERVLRGAGCKAPIMLAAVARAIRPPFDSLPRQLPYRSGL